MSGKNPNPRALALLAILQVVNKGRSADDALQDLITKNSLISERDAALCRALTYGVCRWFYALRSVVAGYLRKPFKAKDIDLEVILMLGLYQLSVMEVDHHAAVNESVKLTQSQKKVWAKGLVNAVLRGLIRDKVNLDDEWQEKSYPAWMIERIKRDWPDQLSGILLAGNQRAPMTLRCDLSQVSVSDYIEELEAAGLIGQAHPHVKSALVLDRPSSVKLLPGFEAGRVSVQDAATQLAAGLLACEPKMHVLDACAAPGGKTLHLLQATVGISVMALDQSESRLSLVADNLNRAQQKAQLVCGDAANTQDWYDGKAYDRILADVPCSASGVIRRHPDIKLLRRSSDIVDLVDQQRKILVALWALLKPGGLLLYSTCSIFKDENEGQIEWFVRNHDNCTVIEPDSVQWGEQRPRGRQILPGSDNMDGFYYACLQKADCQPVSPH